MRKNDIRKIGLDPGFSSIKAAEAGETGVTTYLLPAAVGLGADTESGLSLAGVARPRKRGAQPLEVSFDGLSYLVGPNVALYTRPIHRMDFDRFSDSPELRASLYAALYKLLNGGAHRIALAIALPVKVLQDKAAAQRVERQIRDWLTGSHNFSVNGVETHLEVASVRAKIPQPVASWFEWGMDNSGQWVKGAEALRAPTLVVDQGFNTLDVLVVQNGQISQRHSGGDTLGMRRAAERLTELLRRRYQINPDLLEADALVRRASNEQKTLAYVSGEAVDVSAEARQAVGSLETDVTRFIEGVLSQGQMYRVLLTGGGTMSLMKRLLRLFPNAIVLHEPVLANVRGLAKLANRKGFLG